MIKTQPIHVTIIEDHALTLFGLKASLKEYSFIHIAATYTRGEDFLRELNKISSDIVLMDIGLPGINGIECTKQLKVLYPDIKIIMLTSHECEEEVIESLTSGAHAYCIKNIEPDNLAYVIKTVHSGATWIDPLISPIVLKNLSKPGQETIHNSWEDILTQREAEILVLMTKGLSNTEIAARLSLSYNTIKVYTCKIFEKLGVKDRTQAVIKAMKNT